MRKQYRWFPSVLLVLALLLAGCGGEEKDISGSVTPQLTSAVTQPQDTTAPTEEDNPMSLGRIEGGVYANTYAGFGCELDSDWVYYSAEELQTLPDNVEELFSDSELGASIADSTQIFDMKAENATDLTTMNVIFTKLSMQERLAYALLSESEIMDSILEQQDLLTEAYTQAGIEVSSMEKVQVEFLGQERYAIRTVAATQGIGYYILQLYDYTAGQYSMTLTLGSYIEDQTRDLLDLFYAID